ncbi:MAG: hypothetical protein N2V77_01760 [Canidatus Methanoxibalbensis ujae]|nr:hypothetical protein [Candidatus Methanoxibalbensis ujae]MCW7078451.1 hypothetical protein [Candidatus Methanoxibalbensis ujae]
MRWTNSTAKRWELSKILMALLENNGTSGKEVKSIHPSEQLIEKKG